MLVALPPAVAALGLGGAWILNEMPDMAVAGQRVGRNCSYLGKRSDLKRPSQRRPREEDKNVETLRFDPFASLSFFLSRFQVILCYDGSLALI